MVKTLVEHFQVFFFFLKLSRSLQTCSPRAPLRTVRSPWAHAWRPTWSVWTALASRCRARPATSSPIPTGSVSWLPPSSAPRLIPSTRSKLQVGNNNISPLPLPLAFISLCHDFLASVLAIAIWTLVVSLSISNFVALISILHVL